MNNLKVKIFEFEYLKQILFEKLSDCIHIAVFIFSIIMIK